MNIRVKQLVLKSILIVGAFILFLSIVWSFVNESLIAIIRKGNYRLVLYAITGFWLAVTGSVFMIWGANLFLKKIQLLFNDENFLLRINLLQMKKQDLPNGINKWDIRKQNFRSVMKACKPGVIWIIIGFLIIACGGILTKISEENPLW